eukprot:PRCOL_00003499-RA
MWRGGAKADEPKITGAGLKQLISMGLGTISGDITEINLKDPKRTVVMELESNNFELNEDGQLKQGKYRDEGFVDSEGGGVNTAAVIGALVLAGGAGFFVYKTLGALSDMS